MRFCRSCTKFSVFFRTCPWPSWGPMNPSLFAIPMGLSWKKALSCHKTCLAGLCISWVRLLGLQIESCTWVLRCRSRGTPGGKAQRFLIWSRGWFLLCEEFGSRGIYTFCWGRWRIICLFPEWLPASMGLLDSENNSPAAGAAWFGRYSFVWLDWGWKFF